jgi:hypothetical protein
MESITASQAEPARPSQTPREGHPPKHRLVPCAAIGVLISTNVDLFIEFGLFVSCY